MGFVKGTLVFFLASFLLIALIFGNLALTLSLSIGQENFQENLVENIAKAVAENTETDEQIDSNLAVFQENCANNTEINLELNGTKISIPCEKAKEGSEAVIKESVNDILFETEPDKNIECDNSINCFLKYKGILFSEEAKNYWSKMFYFSLVVVFLIILGMFFLVEERLSLPISVGIITIISSLPFFIINLILPAFKISFLKPISILFSQSYFVFSLMLATGIILVSLGLGIKFFKMGYKISEMFERKQNKKKEMQE